MFWVQRIRALQKWLSKVEEGQEAKEEFQDEIDNNVLKTEEENIAFVSLDKVDYSLKLVNRNLINEDEIISELKSNSKNIYKVYEVSNGEEETVFFNSIDEVPTHALTMGIKNIMNAKKVVLVATGANKQEAVKKLLSNEITTSFPASALHMHKDVVVIIDEEAGKLL